MRPKAPYLQAVHTAPRLQPISHCNTMAVTRTAMNLTRPQPFLHMRRSLKCQERQK